MSVEQVIAWAELAVRSGVGALVCVLIVAVYQTRELKKCHRGSADQRAELDAVKIALVRVYTLLKNALGETDELPPLSDLLHERRGEHRSKPKF